MSETQMWSRLRRLLTQLDPVRIEQRALGVPDVNFVEGWLELKQIKEWPKKPETVVEVRHFTPQQRAWLTRRQTCKGNAWLMLHVDAADDWLLFKGMSAAAHVGHRGKELLFYKSEYAWVNALPDGKVLRALLTGHD